MKKQFLIGFLSGAALFGAIGALAAELAVTPNPFPVLVNGVDNSNIEAYNINDETYFKLRDVGEATGCFDVDFNDNKIYITTKPTEAPATPTPTEIPSKGEFENKVITLDGNPTTGYQWKNISAETDVVSVTEEYVVDEHKEGMVGVGGKYNFTVQGLKAGSCTLKFEYGRSWEDSSAKTAVYNVLVETDGTVTVTEAE